MFHGINIIQLFFPFGTNIIRNKYTFTHWLTRYSYPLSSLKLQVGLKWKTKYITVGSVQSSDKKILEMGKIDTPVRHWLLPSKAVLSKFVGYNKPEQWSLRCQELIAQRHHKFFFQIRFWGKLCFLQFCLSVK